MGKKLKRPPGQPSVFESKVPKKHQGEMKIAPPPADQPAPAATHGQPPGDVGLNPGPPEASHPQSAEISSKRKYDQTKRNDYIYLLGRKSSSGFDVMTTSCTVNCAETIPSWMIRGAHLSLGLRVTSGVSHLSPTAKVQTTSNVDKERFWTKRVTGAQ